jgi:FixJ family two-component response regulator
VKHLPKVFIVEDDPAVLKSLKKLFLGQGYDVRCYASAEEFIAQHHPTQVGCVVVDLLVPGIGGDTLLRFLEDSGSLLGVVVTSGLVSNGWDLKRTYSIPVLEKPYEVSALLKIVEGSVAGSIRRRSERTNRDVR